MWSGEWDSAWGGLKCIDFQVEFDSFEIKWQLGPSKLTVCRAQTREWLRKVDSKEWREWRTWNYDLWDAYFNYAIEMVISEELWLFATFSCLLSPPSLANGHGYWSRIVAWWRGVFTRRLLIFLGILSPENRLFIIAQVPRRSERTHTLKFLDITLSSLCWRRFCGFDWEFTRGQHLNIRIMN